MGVGELATEFGLTASPIWRGFNGKYVPLFHTRSPSFFESTKTQILFDFVFVCFSRIFASERIAYGLRQRFHHLLHLFVVHTDGRFGKGCRRRHRCRSIAWSTLGRSLRTAGEGVVFLLTRRRRTTMRTITRRRGGHDCSCLFNKIMRLFLS